MATKNFQPSNQEGVFKLTTEYALVHLGGSAVGEVDLVVINKAMPGRGRIFFEIRDLVRPTAFIYQGQAELPAVIPVSRDRALFVKGGNLDEIFAYVQRNGVDFVGATLEVNGGTFEDITGTYDLLIVGSGGAQLVAPGQMTLSPGTDSVILLDSEIEFLAATNPTFPILADLLVGMGLLVDIFNSAGTNIGAITQVSALSYEADIPDLDITVNGSAYGSTPATVDFDVDVVDSITRAPIGSLNAFGEWQVTTGAAPVGAILTKTGQTVSYRTGDDGDIQAGRDLSFVKLSWNNPFGHNWRITGTTGGYYDEDTSQYKTAAGAVTVLLGAFPDRIAIDWTQFDGSTVLGYASPVFSGTGNTWNLAVDNALAYTVGAYVSGWRIGNWLEYVAIMRNGHLSPWSWGYPPFDITSLTYWTGTTSPIGAAYAMSAVADGRILYEAKTLSGVRRYWPVRRFTVTGTTLT